MFGKGRTRKTFGQRISNILRTFTFQQLDVAITHELPQIMHSSVNSGIFAHHDTRDIILPYFCGADLSEIETPQYARR